MTIQSIYSRYQIMPNLREHQLRVAGVAQIICNAMKPTVDTKEIVSACLLHDMGNIIKFNLELFPAFLEPEGLTYWKKVQNDYIRTYGNDEHHATISIAEEILDEQLQSQSEQSIKDRILELLHAIGFSNAKKNVETTNLGKKIAAYADMRVKPQGVTSMKDRLTDGRKRFSRLQRYEKDIFEEMTEYLSKIESQIFAQSSIHSNIITEEGVQDIIPTLQSVFHTLPTDQKDR